MTCCFIDSIKKFLVPPKRTVLVVDDAELDRMFVVGALKRHYRVLTADGGQSGIEAARQHRPDLILLDYMMPDLNGPAVCRVLKNDPVTADIPVIFLTSMDGADTMSDGFEEGADNYLTKPIGKKELLGQVARRLRPVNFS